MGKCHKCGDFTINMINGFKSCDCELPPETCGTE